MYCADRRIVKRSWILNVRIALKMGKNRFHCCPFCGNIRINAFGHLLNNWSNNSFQKVVSKNFNKLKFIFSHMACLWHCYVLLTVGFKIQTLEPKFIAMSLLHNSTRPNFSQGLPFWKGFPTQRVSLSAWTT